MTSKFKPLIKVVTILVIVIVPIFLIPSGIGKELLSSIALAVFTLLMGGIFGFLAIGAIDKDEYFIAYIYACVAIGEMLIFWYRISLLITHNT
jgi:membrane protein required for beta-lactamase induction